MSSSKPKSVAQNRNSVSIDQIQLTVSNRNQINTWRKSRRQLAYSTVGTLRAFLSGKISHYFGWSGPSLTFDTACSSSAVAIHTACATLQRDECSQALAGGVAVFTTPYLYENLATAHFLSPTGATKPFDASADGYCRGEGIGLVLLKKLSRALQDKDDIQGVIAGSALNQNSNCVPITVPHSISQGTLYRRVAKQAGISPQDVTFVEAHGTGTPVGDPIEIESIRSTFGFSIFCCRGSQISIDKHYIHLRIVRYTYR